MKALTLYVLILGHHLATAAPCDDRFLRAASAPTLAQDLAWIDDPGPIPPRIERLSQLLRRARADHAPASRSDQAARELIGNGLYGLVFNENADLSWAAAYALVALDDPTLAVPNGSLLALRGAGVDERLREDLERYASERDIRFVTSVILAEAKPVEKGTRLSMEIQVSRRIPVDLVGGPALFPKPDWLTPVPSVGVGLQYSRRGLTGAEIVGVIDLGLFNEDHGMRTRTLTLTLPVTVDQLALLETVILVDDVETNEHAFNHAAISLLATPAVNLSRH